MNYQFDVLIIGCGISGLAAGIKLAEAGMQVGIVTREEDPRVSNTFYAQGGIVHTGGNDNIIEDIMKASSGTSNLAAANVVLEKSGDILTELLIEKAQTEFETSKDGNFLYTKEAAHSRARILYNGDYTGKQIQISLLNYLKDKVRFPNIYLLTQHTAIDLLTPAHHGTSFMQRYEDNKIVGAYLFDQRNGQVSKALAKITILATGGIGAMYLHHTNAEGARGDGHAMAKRAGAILTNMEFIQFHPTTFFDQSGHRRFLISEAVRGEGGKLLNSNGESFMQKYHLDMELAPRDVVARSIVEETILSKHDCVYLDISHMDGDWVKTRFPTIYEHCLKKNVDITKEPIPVVPAAHYSCGGVKTDLRGRTNLMNLYAIGEIACTGLHGANRLASLSLLEGLTWGYLTAEDIKKSTGEIQHYSVAQIKDWENGTVESDEALVHQDWITLKQTMWNYVGLIRSTERLNRANAMFKHLQVEIQHFYRNSYLTDSLIGLRNAVEVGNAVLSASSRNKESLGCFYRKN